MAKFQVKAAILVIAFAAVATANSVESADDCPLICPALYAPVCATNGRTYKEFVNPCILKQNNCRLERAMAAQFVRVVDEWCSSEFVENLYEKLGKPDLTTPECYHPCTMIYDPVCVSNGIFRGLASNECEMETFNKCLGDKIKSLKVLRKGSC